MQKILVIGSTGKVGSQLVQLLVQAGEHVRAATRNPSALASTANIEPTLFDYANPTAFEAALEGVNRVFLMEPPFEGTSPQLMISLVEAAARSRCKIVLMSSASVEFNSTEPLLEVEAAIKTTGRPFVILRPNWFMDNFHTMWLEPILQAGIIPAPAADSRTAFIDTRDIALAAAAALRSDQFNNSTLTLTGPESLTYAEAAFALSQASGRNIRYVPIGDATYRQSLLDAGLPPDLASYITGLFGPTREGRAATVNDSFQKLTARQPHAFADYASHNASAWK